MQRDYIKLSLLALLLFVPFLGAVHLFDWDEINFAECAREMALGGSWLLPTIDFAPFWEKPPFFIWMQALSMKVFGVNEFAARFPNALCGWATLLLIYRIGLRVHDRLFAWLWVLVWIGSILPHFYFRSGIIDPWFNLFIFAGLYGFIEFRWQFFTAQSAGSWLWRHRYLLLGGAALGMAVMTKGPAALLIVFSTLMLYWAKYRFRNKGFFTHLIYFVLASGLASSLWFAIETAVNGPWFVREFVAYQIRLFSTPDSGHGGFPGYHVVILLLGAFPASVFAIANLWGDRQSEDEMLESDTLLSCKRSDLATWMQFLFWVVLILFSLVKTKIVHYSSLAYYPITYLAALTLWRAICWRQFYAYIPWLLLPIAILLGGAVFSLPFIGQNPEWLRPLFIRDPFAAGNLEARVEWHLYQGFPGLLLISGAVLGAWYWQRKKAWFAAQIIYIAGLLFVSLTLVSVVGNIEAYSQRAAIEFYQSKRGEDCYIRTMGFKSYAHLYYADKRNLPAKFKLTETDSLLYGRLDKPAYFVAKVSNLHNLPDIQDARELYQKNGFVFFERQPGRE